MAALAHDGAANARHEQVDGVSRAGISPEQLQQFRAYVAELIEVDIARREMQNRGVVEGPTFAIDLRRAFARAECIAHGLAHFRIEPQHLVAAMAIDPDGHKELKERKLAPDGAFEAAWTVLLGMPRSSSHALPHEIEHSPDLEVIIAKAHELARSRVYDHRSTKTGDIMDVILGGADYGAFRDMLNATRRDTAADRAAKGVEQLQGALSSVETGISEQLKLNVSRILDGVAELKNTEDSTPAALDGALVLDNRSVPAPLDLASEFKQHLEPLLTRHFDDLRQMATLEKPAQPIASTSAAHNWQLTLLVAMATLVGGVVLGSALRLI